MTTKEHLTKHDREIAEIWPLMGKLAKGTLAAQEETRELRASMGELRAEMRQIQANTRAAQEETRQLRASMRELRATVQDESRKTWTVIRELAAAQKRTEAALRTYLESRRATNGHTKRKIDLQ